MSTFVNNVQQRLGGREYLNFKYVTYPLEGDFVGLGQRLAKDQLTIFARRFNKMQKDAGAAKHSYQFRQIRNLMRRFGGEGAIGQALVTELEHYTSPQTAGGLQIEGIEIGGETASLAMANAIVQKDAKFLVENIEKFITSIDKGAQQVITALAENNEHSLAEAVAICYSTGEPLPAEFALNNTRFSQAEVASAMQYLTKNIITIKNGLNTMSSIDGSGVASDDLLKSYQSALQSITAAFNQVGGLLGEMIVNLAIITGITKLEEALENTNKEIAKDLAKLPGSYLKQEWTGQRIGATSGKQVKEDVHITWNGTSGELLLAFGGSVKVRQGRKFRKSANRRVSGFIAAGSTFGSLIGQLERYLPGVTKQAQSTAAALQASEDDTNWWYLIRILGILSLVDALSGLGAGNSGFDLASLLIINNQVFSIPDILEQSLIKLDLMNKGNNGFVVDGLDLSAVKNRNAAVSQTEGISIVQQAVKRIEYVYTNLMASKIRITLNLGLMFPGAF